MRFERALRRAGVPIAYSAGFTPHPKVSYAGAVATGVASEAEYVELGVSEVVDPAALRAALDARLPPGLDVLEVVDGRRRVARRPAGGVGVRDPAARGRRGDAAAAAAALLAAEVVEVERMTKNGMRTVRRPGGPRSWSPRAGAAGCRRACRGGRAGRRPPCAILQVVVRHTTPAVRPDDVLAALRQVADLAPPVPPQVTRLAQGPLDAATGAVSDPLVLDRA